MELYTALSLPKGEGAGVGLLVNSSLLSHREGSVSGAQFISYRNIYSPSG